MHPEAYLQMGKLLDHWVGKPANVLDVGSFDVNGNYRPLVQMRGHTYTGLDQVAGKNVDIVSPDPYNYPLSDNEYDIVISGSTMEHVEALWLWVPELTRVLRPGGMLAIITHTHWAYHPHPVDCWRVMPDGMQYLFNLTGVLGRYQIEMYCTTDISGLAWKR
jgi:SAM-dependent methyltransferase